MSRPSTGRAALLVALAAVWSVAAWFLWQSRVPGSLHLAHLDPHSYSSAGQLHATE